MIYAIIFIIFLILMMGFKSSTNKLPDQYNQYEIEKGNLLYQYIVPRYVGSTYMKGDVVTRGDVVARGEDTPLRDLKKVDRIIHVLSIDSLNINNLLKNTLVIEHKPTTVNKYHVDNNLTLYASYEVPPYTFAGPLNESITQMAKTLIIGNHPEIDISKIYGMVLMINDDNTPANVKLARSLKQALIHGIIDNTSRLCIVCDSMNLMKYIESRLTPRINSVICLGSNTAQQYTKDNKRYLTINNTNLSVDDINNFIMLNGD